MLFLFGTVILFTRCDEPAQHFVVPQPEGENDLSKFPLRFRGNFLSSKDSSILQIGERYIARIYDFTMEGNINKIDSNFRLIGDSLLLDIQENDTFRIVRQDSLLRLQIHMIDTIFNAQLKDWYRLRKMKGYLFLNNWCGDSCWMVQKIEIKRGRLSIGDLKVPEDIEKLDAITENPEPDSTGIRNYQPSKREFRKFVRQSGFSEKEDFIRIRYFPLN